MSITQDVGRREEGNRLNDAQQKSLPAHLVGRCGGQFNQIGYAGLSWWRVGELMRKGNVK